MRNLAGIAAGLLAGFLAGPVVAQGAGLVAGPAGTAEPVIARDLMGEGTACGITVSPISTTGSMENASAVRDRSGVQLGFVQEDTLEYIRTLAPGDSTLRRMAQGLSVVMPLHSQAIHVLARRELAGLEDLDGQRVSLGNEGSGTQLTAGLVLDVAGVAPAARIEDLAPQASLDALLAGEIDAMFLVDGVPSPLLADARIDPARFHLLGLTQPVLTALYTPSRITPGAYPVAPNGVETVAVRSVLMTFDFSATGNAYHRASCAAVADVAQLIVSRIEPLQAGGHPAWRSVDFADLPADWLVSPCALAGLEPGRAELTCQTAPPVQAAADLPAPNALFLERICARGGC